MLEDSNSWLDELLDDADIEYDDDDELIELEDDMRGEELEYMRSRTINRLNCKANGKKKYNDRHKISKGRSKHGGSRRKTAKTRR